MNIAGARNHSGHDSSAQKSIWHCLMMLSNFEAVKADILGFPEDCIISGEKDFYQFMETLYRDMNINPVKYFIPISAYEKYINGTKTDRPFTKAHQTDAKECKLRNEIQQAIEFYPNYFYAMGKVAEGICKETFSLIIEKSKYDSALRSLDRPHIFKDNGQRLEALASAGIIIDESNSMCFISCKKYLKMFLGLHVLCSAPESKYKYMNYLRLDYKGYYRSMPNLEDIKQTMTKEHAVCVDSILLLFNNAKIKYRVKPLRSIVSSHGWKVEYTVSGKNVFGFFAEPDYLALYIYFNDPKNITAISKEFENDFELFEWFCSAFPDRLCKCPSNRVVIFGGVKRRICGLSNRAEIINPCADDIEKSITVIKRFHSI